MQLENPQLMPISTDFWGKAEILDVLIDEIVLTCAIRAYDDFISFIVFCWCEVPEPSWSAGDILLFEALLFLFL